MTMLSVINKLITDDILSNVHMEKLKQEVKTFLMLQPLNILPPVVVTPQTIKTILLLLLNCNFATVGNSNVSI